MESAPATLLIFNAARLVRLDQGVNVRRKSRPLTNIIYLIIQPIRGLLQALDFALIKLIDQLLVRFCVERRVPWISEVTRVSGK